jgi:hypothetical protein
MTASNHVVTGAVIAVAVGQPILALPLAFASHFVLDVLPHYGADNHTSRLFLYSLVVDMGIAASFLLYLVLQQPDSWLLLFACAVLAASPDLLWLPYWVLELRGKPKPLGKVAHWLAKIQWGERSWGIIIELVWFAVMMTIFIKLTAPTA